MIEVSHLTKRYGPHTAVSDVSFVIEQGGVYGLLGPNGAGKSTTMNIITGCLGATEGTVTIGGYDIFEQPREAKALIGYLPEQPPVYGEDTPREYLTFVARAKGVAKSERKAAVERAMEVTGLTDVADRLIRNLSKGYRQRVGIAQVILGNPAVVILDEPTVGLDPRQILEIRDLIRELGKTHTVILSSHILSEVRAVCGTILILSKGKLVACDTAEHLERRLAGKTVVYLTAEGSESLVGSVLEACGILQSAEIKEAEGLCQVRIESAEDEQTVSRSLFRCFSEAGCPILGLRTEKADLEAVFMELTAEKEEDA